MQTFKSLFRSRSIRFKLQFYFIILILLPIITLGILGNIIYSKSIEKEAANNTMQMVQQVNKNIEFYIEKMQNIMQYISEQPKIIEYMKLKSMNDPNRIRTEADVRRFLKPIKDNYPEISGILLVNKNDIYLSNELYKTTRNPLIYDIWYKRASINNGSVLLFSKLIDRNLTTSLGYTADDVVSVVKAVNDPVSGKSIGVILIDMKLETLEKVIEDIKLGNSGFIYVMDSSGEIVNAPVNKTVYRVKANWFADNNFQKIRKKIGDSSYQIMYSYSEYTKWKTVGVFSVNETLKEVRNLRYYCFIIATITLMIALAVAIFFTSTISKPINKLKRLMRIAEGGNFDVKFASENNDEIGQLGNSFNTMIGEIKKLINLVYIEQKSKREAELKILQAQIKPHFLYNTLDNIQWMALQYGAKDIMEMVGALTTLFRVGLSKGDELIKVSDELEHIKSYLLIQKVRYADIMDYDISFDEDIMKYYMIKLTLQPIVENAIYHGVKERPKNGRVTITASKLEGKLLFTIADNGPGIPKEKLEEIIGLLQGKSSKDNKSGYGIYNVNERIKLSYGNGFGVKICSSSNSGTVVEIYHPIIERKGKECVR